MYKSAGFEVYVATEEGLFCDHPSLVKDIVERLRRNPYERLEFLYNVDICEHIEANDIILTDNDIEQIRLLIG